MTLTTARCSEVDLRRPRLVERWGTFCRKLFPGRQ